MSDKWVVRFPGVREVFETWTAAHRYLLTEIQYMALDHDSEANWKAWERVRYWSLTPGTYEYRINAGDPPGEYLIVRIDYEKE